jgi:hypothetical protein
MQYKRLMHVLRCRAALRHVLRCRAALMKLLISFTAWYAWGGMGKPRSQMTSGAAQRAVQDGRQRQSRHWH